MTTHSRWLLSDADRAGVRAQLELDNIRLRGDYLREERLLAGAEVRVASGLSPKNRSEPASRWKREGRVFAIRHQGRDFYPAFQFEDGRPRPVIAQVLREAPSGATGWQLARWFASGNGWLDGAEPRERLDAPEDVEDVIGAARRLASGAEG